MELKARHVFLFLCIVFIAYSANIYLMPMNADTSKKKNNSAIANGRLIWQKYNCQACHQLYGLGGYLGPDLTNIISDSLKGETLIRAMIKSGIKQMPSFDLSEKEVHDLLEFLKDVDKSGKADPRNFKPTVIGTIETHE